MERKEIEKGYLYFPAVCVENKREIFVLCFQEMPGSIKYVV